jgi:hypothetical protein
MSTATTGKKKGYYATREDVAKNLTALISAYNPEDARSSIGGYRREYFELFDSLFYKRNPGPVTINDDDEKLRSFFYMFLSPSMSQETEDPARLAGLIAEILYSCYGESEHGSGPAINHSDLFATFIRRQMANGEDDGLWLMDAISSFEDLLRCCNTKAADFKP